MEPFPREVRKELLDLLLKDGFLIDPERMTMLPGSLGVKNGRIAGAYSVGADAPEAAEVVPLGGKAVAPGFIDVHAHLDGHAKRRQALAASGNYNLVRRQLRSESDRYRSVL